MPSARTHGPARSSRRVLRLAAPLSLLLLAAAGCGGDDERAAADPTSSPSVSQSPSATSSGSPSESASPSASPSASASSTPSSPTASPEDDDEPTATPAAPGTGPTGTPASDLLAAGELPGLNSGSPWTARGTSAVGSEPFGACQKVDVLSLGARGGVERRFDATDATGAQQVVDFPDTQTASRAAQVLASWHRDCASRLPGTDGRVRDRQAVPVRTGSAWWYLATWEESGEGRVQTFGIALDDTRMTLLRMGHTGQDHNYPAGRDPLQRGLVAAAAKMGG